MVDLDAIYETSERQSPTDALRSRAREFCQGAFGPFGVDIEPYTEIITELLQGAVDDECPRLSRDLAAARREEEMAEAIQARYAKECDRIAGHYIAVLSKCEQERDAARRECAEMRERAIEECAVAAIVEGETHYSGDGEIYIVRKIAKRIRALAKPEHKEGGDD